MRKRSKPRAAEKAVYEIVTFPSRLGWMAIIAAGKTVKQLTFGHLNAAAARAALDPRLAVGASIAAGPGPLGARLSAYAEGAADDFRDVSVENATATEFQRRVLAMCRKVRYGSTITYAELAANAGCPGAARAVGNCMAANRTPLITPCHRVVCADGRLGSYSAEGGTEMKRRLLAMECGK